MTVARLTGLALVASFLVFFPVALLYFTRDMVDAGGSRLLLERSLVILAVLLTTLEPGLLRHRPAKP